MPNRNIYVGMTEEEYERFKGFELTNEFVKEAEDLITQIAVVNDTFKRWNPITREYTYPIPMKDIKYLSDKLGHLRKLARGRQNDR